MRVLRNFAFAVRRRRSLALGLLAAACLILALPSPSPAAAKKKLLVLHSYHQGFLWTDNIMAGIASAVGDPEKNGIELYVEYMDTKRFPTAALFPRLRELYARKYVAAARPDAVITTDDDALDFMLAYGDSLFPGAPVAFCGPNAFEDARIAGHDNYTGVVEEYDLKSTIELALRLHPKARHVAAITDVTSTGKYNLERLQKLEPLFAGKADFIELSGLSTGELQDALRRLPADTVVLHLSFYRDRDGKGYTVNESTRLIKDSTALPLYSCWDFMLGNGIIGGKVVSGAMQGATAAGMALKILNGAPVKDIPVLKESPNRYMFDYPALAKAGLSEAALPEDSVILNRPVSTYQLYKKQIWAAAAGMLVMLGLIAAMGVNILLRRRAQRDLRLALDELQRMFDNSQVGFLFVQRNRVIRRANQRMAEIAGYDGPFDLIDKDAKMLHLSAESYRSFGERYYPGLAGGEQVRMEFQIKRRDGRPVWVMLSGAALDASRPADLDKGVLWVMDDISERKRAEEALAALNRRLEEIVSDRTRELKAKAAELTSANARLKDLDAMKSSFLSTVSHDLRTPLTSIRGFAKLIGKDLASAFLPLAADDGGLLKKGERMRDNLRIIEQEGERMTRLINDFLDLAKIESGRLTWRDQESLLNDIVLRAVEAAGGQFTGKPGLELKVEVEDGLPPIVVDPDRIAQVVINLLNNAAKYTEQGSVSITAALAGPGKVKVSVADTGIGIPEKDLTKIFDKFHQVDQGDTLPRAQKGSGLGLAICREIVSRYKGEIWAESTLGRGSVFHFTLPATAVAV